MNTDLILSRLDGLTADYVAYVAVAGCAQMVVGTAVACWLVWACRKMWRKGIDDEEEGLLVLSGLLSILLLLALVFAVDGLVTLTHPSGSAVQSIVNALKK